MANYAARIMNNAVRSLSVQQALIAVTGNNIANVNTPGYARRIVNLETNVDRNNASGGIQIGAGVKLGSVTRQVDEYLNRMVRDTTMDVHSASVQNDYLSRLQGLFSLNGESNTIGTAMAGFFSSVNDLSVNPSSIELRSAMMERAADLVNSISSSYNAVASMQREADQRLQSEIEVVNSLSAQIADMNAVIAQTEAGGSSALDARDQRDQLMEKLAEKISFSTMENDDGTMMLTLSNGFALVNGTQARMLETSQTPSFASGGTPPSLGGGQLSYIVFDYGASGTEAHIDLTGVIGNGGGTLGGLLAVRGVNNASNQSAFDGEGTLVGVASRIEAITRKLLTEINLEYLGPDSDGTTIGLQPSSGDLDGNLPSVFGLFSFDYDGTLDDDGDGRPEQSDLDASGLDNFSSRLQLAFSDPRRIAAARSSDNPPVFSEGDGSNLTALSALESSPFDFAVGNFSLSGATLDQCYNETVTYVGNAKSRANINESVAGATLTSAANQRDEVSAVSLDEEFAKLIHQQKAFQASARMIKVATDLLDHIVSIL